MYIVEFVVCKYHVHCNRPLYFIITCTPLPPPLPLLPSTPLLLFVIIIIIIIIIIIVVVFVALNWSML